MQTGGKQAAPMPLFSAPGRRQRRNDDPQPRRAAGSRTAGAGGRATRQPNQLGTEPRQRRARRRDDAPSPLRPFGGSPDAAPPADPFATLSPTPPPASPAPAGLAVFTTDGQLLAVNQERREMVCSVIGLTIKLGLVAVTGLSLVRIAGAYQQRMDSNGEIVAVLELEKARLERARERFDDLFMVEGEQRLIREQSQWIAPNRLRVIWQSAVALPKPAPHPQGR